MWDDIFLSQSYLTTEKSEWSQWKKHVKSLDFHWKLWQPNSCLKCFFCSWNGTPLDEGPCHSSPRTSSQVFSALTNPPWKGLKMTMRSGVAPSLIFTPKKVELLVRKLYKDIATVHRQHLDDSPTYFLLKKWFNLLQKIPKMKFRHFNLLHSLHHLLRIWCAVYISIFLEARWIVGEA